MVKTFFFSYDRIKNQIVAVPHIHQVWFRFDGGFWEICRLSMEAARLSQTSYIILNLKSESELRFQFLASQLVLQPFSSSLWQISPQIGPTEPEPSQNQDRT